MSDSEIVAENDTRRTSESETSINSLLGACARSFASALNPQLYNHADYVNSSVDLDEELGRLRLWAGNLRAHRKPRDRLSLDHRLREAPELLKLACEHLSDIRDSLQAVNTAVRSEVVTSAHQQTRSPLLESDDSNWDELISEMRKESGSFPVLTDYLLDISHAITSLYKFSVALANPARRDVSAKATKITLEFDVNYDILHEAQKFGFPEDCTLAQRLGKANAKRRQMLAYHRQHKSKISKHEDAYFKGHTAHDTQNVADATSHQDTTAVKIAVSVPVVKSTKSTEWTQDATVSTVLNHDVLETASETARTVFPGFVSTADHTMPQSRIPLPPLP
ncbi:hypothetical protein BDW74DRAFT_174004 [Aspergillus multicolor]|uniref:uncharacterized protein n=1 Tax=Aspergillus multicolor TaxID=41759 RepID=UPI003CCDD9C0